MKNKILFFFLGSFIVLNFLYCKYNSADKQSETPLLLTVFANSQHSSTSIANPIVYNCPDPSPPFSSLAAAGTTANCAKSGCHDTATAQSGVDMTNYNSVVSKTVSGDPVNSWLFIMITQRTMKFSSNLSIDTAVYCWIKGGVLP